jgi:hypothetical protein
MCMTGGGGDGPANSRLDAGETRVIFGKSNLPLHIDLSTNPPADMLSIYGGTTSLDPAFYSPDRLGEEIVTADVNGDKIADIIIGAYRADSVNDKRRDGGEVYIVYGSSALPGQTIDMANPPADVTIIYGSKEGAITGDSIAAGDIQGDGYDDLFITIPGDTGPNGRRAAGGIVVINGGPDIPHEIDLAQPNVPLICVEGADRFDFSAYWSASGDLDGGGFQDAMPNGMIGDGPGNQRRNSGEAYVLSGKVLSSIFDKSFEIGITPSIQIQVPTLRQNAPNPFNTGTAVRYLLADGPPRSVFIRLHNIQGQMVRMLLRDDNQVAGDYILTWDGNDTSGQPLPSGTYFCELISNGHRDYKKLVIVR